MKLKQFFRDQKKRKGWTYEELAKRLRDEIPDSTYGFSRPGAWFGNEGIPAKPEVLDALCKVFELDPADLGKHMDAHDRIRYKEFLGTQVSERRQALLERLEALSDDRLEELLRLLEGLDDAR